MKVYFLFGIPLEDVYQKMAEDLSRRYGISKFCGMVWGKDRLRYLNHLNQGKINWSQIEVISKHTRKEALTSGPDFGYLKNREQEYGIPNLTTIVYSDRWFNSLAYKKVTKLLEIFLRLVEQAYDRMRPDIVIIDPEADMMSYIHYIIAKKRGISCYSFDSARIPGRISIHSNPYRFWERVNCIFERKKKTALADEQRKKAEEFLTNFRKGNSKVTISPQLRNKNLIKSSDLAIFFRALRDWLIDPYNPIPWRPWNMIRHRFIRIFRKGLLKCRKCFDAPIPGEKYVLFPLHYQPEASTLVLAPFYTDQLALVEDMAKCLPIDYKLYVKEHPVNLTSRPLSYYKRIRKLWNVRLVNPLANSYQLIQNASAVATISGTMGWEALLFGKPVISFGKVGYNSFPLVVKAGEQAKNQWPNIFQNAVENFRPDGELLLKYISAVLEGTFPGVMAPAPVLPKVLEDKNIQKLCDALMIVADSIKK